MEAEEQLNALDTGRAERGRRGSPRPIVWRRISRGTGEHRRRACAPGPEPPDRQKLPRAAGTRRRRNRGANRNERAPAEESPEEKRLYQFVDFVVGDAQNTWQQVLGNEYRRAKVVVFRGRTPTACGVGQSAMGPFYCPADEKVYIDLGFYDELRRRFGAPGDFAQAYVIAHELGHHVQHLRGIDARVREVQESRPDAANQLSVRLELQADCLAGIWGHSTAQRNILEQGDAEEALNAAAAIGDDRIQNQSGRGVQPDSFTHGSSAQRVEWFRRGLESGDLNRCDTFGRGSD